MFQYSLLSNWLVYGIPIRSISLTFSAFKVDLSFENFKKKQNRFSTFFHLPFGLCLDEYTYFWSQLFVNIVDIPNTQMNVLDEKMTLTVSIFMVSFWVASLRYCSLLPYYSFGVYLFQYIFLFVYFVTTYNEFSIRPFYQTPNTEVSNRFDRSHVWSFTWNLLFDYQ